MRSLVTVSTIYRTTVCAWALTAAAGFAQTNTSSQFPTPAPLPTPNLSASQPVLPQMPAYAGPGTPPPMPTPYNLNQQPTSLANPVQVTLASPTPTPAATPAPGVTPAPTPLPDGTMPLTPPPLPTPVLPDASTLSDQLPPLPTPTQSAENLLPTKETGKMESSEELAMKQKMVMADFEKSLTALIARQRNPNVADLTLNDAVQISLKQNPQILNAIQQIRLTRGQLIQVVSQVMPQLGISSGYTQQAQDLTTNGRSTGTTIEIPNTNGKKPTVLTFGGSQGGVQNQTWNIQFQATQTIFDLQAVAGISAGSSTYNSAFFSLRATIDNIVSQVVTQFYQVVLNRALIVAQEQNVNLLQQQVKDQQNRYEAGTVPRFNVLQAEVALANAQPPLIQAQNAYRISLYQLVALLGMDYPKGRPSEVPFNVVGNLGYNPRKIDTDESIRVAIARNPSLKAQRLDILSNGANVNAQLAGFLPTVSANGGYQYTNNTGSTNLADTLAGWFFGATGTWNIWDGGLTYGNVAQAKAQLMQSKNTYDNGIRQVVLDVQQSISNLQQAKETIDSQTASVVQATEALRLARERLDAGAGTQLDVLNAQVQLLQAQTNVLQARYDYIAAMASYDYALSLDTQYVETFSDPLVRPLNPQALSKAETAHFEKATNPEKPQPALPRAFRNNDPIKPILETNPTPAPKKKQTKANPSK